MTFTGIAPVMVAHVDPRSPAERAGVRVGDLIARVNGHDVLYASRETVHSIVKYSQVYIGVHCEVYIGVHCEVYIGVHCEILTNNLVPL